MYGHGSHPYGSYDKDCRTSESGLEILANKSVYVSAAELQQMKDERHKEEYARRERRRREDEYSRKVESHRDRWEPSQTLDNDSDSDLRQRMRKLGLTRVTQSPREYSTTRGGYEGIGSAVQDMTDNRTRDFEPNLVNPKIMDDAVAAVIRKLNDPRMNSNVKRYLAEELRRRYNGLADDESELDSIHSDGDMDLQEMKYWQKQLSLEDREIEGGFTTVIVLAADMIESILSEVMDFHAFETRDLSGKVQEAVDDGRFRSAIRHFCNSGSAQFMKNPYYNALTTFASIALKNHMDHQKGVVTKIRKSNPEVGKRRKKARENVQRRKKNRNDRKKRRMKRREVISSSDSDSSSEDSRTSSIIQPPIRPLETSKKHSSVLDDDYEEVASTCSQPSVVSTPRKSETLSQTDIDNLTNMVDGLIGRADQAEKTVVDKVTGRQRRELADNGSGPADILNGMGSLESKISVINDSVARNLEIEEEREKLGPAPLPTFT